MSKNILQDRPEAQKAHSILLQKLQGIRDEIGKQPIWRNNAFMDHVSGLERDSKQFESSISIIVSLGMLKAGKSTLVNILARSAKASPTGYGYDTTLRPALIRMMEETEEGADKGRIVIYHFDFEHKAPAAVAPAVQAGDKREQPGSADTAGHEGESSREDIETDQRNKMLKRVLDKLRGISHGDGFSTTVLDLTEENLELALCKDVKSPEAVNTLRGIDPLIVVVETPYMKEGVLLRDGRMLMDMPGLDSAKSNTARHFKRYEALISECDAALFVQSSVAPLNKEAQEHLKDSLKARSSATIYVIQNKMLSKPWLLGSINADAQNKQLEHALKLVDELAQEVAGATPAKFQINLGMASDSLFVSPDKFHDKYRLECKDSPPVTKEGLWQLSEMALFETALKESIDKNGITNRIIHCCDVLNNNIAGFVKQVNSEKQRREEELAALTKDQDAWKEILGDLQKDLDSYAYHKPGTASFKEYPALDSIVTKAEQDCGMNQTSVEGSKIDGFLSAVSERLCAACREHLQNSCYKDVRVKADESEIALTRECEDQVKNFLSKWKDAGGYRDEVDGRKAELFRTLQTGEKPNYHSDISRETIKLNVDAFLVKPIARRFYQSTAVLTKIVTFGLCTEKSYSVNAAEKPWEQVLRNNNNGGGLLQQYINELNAYLENNIESRLQSAIRQELDKGTQCLKEALAKRIAGLDKAKSAKESEIEGMKAIVSLLGEMKQETANIKNSNQRH